MNIAKTAFKNSTLIHFLLILILIGGLISYQKLGRLEDAPFVIKQARITTSFPGATAIEVEELITNKIETELQKVRNYDILKSESRAEISIIDFILKPNTPPDEVPQIWDEMRNKLREIEHSLPEGAGTILINDDFGDVFGYYFALVADQGYSYRELEKYADLVRKEIVSIDDVAKVELYGVQQQVIDVEISRSKMAQLGILPSQIQEVLNGQNKLVSSGNLYSSSQQIKIDSKGTFQSVNEIGEVILRGKDDNMVRLNEVANISKSYQDPPSTLMRVNGFPAIAIGVSTAKGGNAITMGEAVISKLSRLKQQLPIGIELQQLYSQDKVAIEANQDFIINLIISISIVVLLILLAMGVRAGILIGSGLLFAIIGTTAFMLPLGIELHRTSLAAFIIAMGMLVDNAIVVTDNALVNIKSGKSIKEAFIQGAYLPQWGLLGATIIAIVSFIPLYMAQSAAGELVAPFFVVLGISLLLSWIFALIQTPTYGQLLIKPTHISDSTDPYNKPFYLKLESFIKSCIAKRWITLGIVFLAFVVSLLIFKTVERDFIAPIKKPMFRVEYLMPAGTSIYKLKEDVVTIENFLLDKEDIVENVSVALGSSALRFYLASKSFSLRPNFANFTIELKDAKQVDKVMQELKQYIQNNLPDGMPIMSKFIAAAQPEFTLEATFIGSEIDTLRMLAEKGKAVLLQEPKAEFVRDSWDNKVPQWTPTYSQTLGQNAGVSRVMLSNALRRLSSGVPAGEYREEDKSIPILIKDVDRKKYNFSNLGSFQMLNSNGELIALEQVTKKQEIIWENWVIRHYNRERAIAAQCEPINGIKNPELESLVMGKIDAIPLPEGYKLLWDGMYYKQKESVESILAPFPLALLIMVFILVLLFNSVKKMLIIFALVPLILIGIVVGLKVSGLPFSFFSILGVLGLIGMVIKNGIVLIEQANLEMKENGKSPFQAIVYAAKARALPVTMAAVTTIFGMIPLVFDAMFGGLAVTMMGGLAIATVLTIIVIPVLYAAVYNLKNE